MNNQRSAQIEAEFTNFGFAKVKIDDKASMVQGLFSRVAGRYDLMNDVLSIGLHRIWKRFFVTYLAPYDGEHILDMAGGTGDIANLISQYQKRNLSTVVCDLTSDMLLKGQQRYPGIAQWVCANAEQLPFPDNSFDAYVIAFGMRNVTRRKKALQEARRVLRPGGRFLCLEFTPQVLPILQPVYDWYSFKVMPKIGNLLASDADAYRYLAESIRNFPTSENFAQELQGAGFVGINIYSLSAGIVAIHKGWKIS